MAISFGRALLAGAAGVAEYSNEERAARQARLDRVQELQNRMKVEQAKSAYAAKLTKYEKNKAIRDQVTPGMVKSAGGQILLGTLLTGKSAEDVARLAKNGIKWKLPEEMEAPVFEMPEVSQAQRAKSPIQNWVENYRQQKGSLDIADENKTLLAAAMQPLPDPTPTGNETPDEIASVPQAPQDPMEPEAPAEDMDFSDFLPEQELEIMDITKQDGTKVTVAVDRKTGKRVWENEIEGDNVSVTVNEQVLDDGTKIIEGVDKNTGETLWSKNYKGDRVEVDVTENTMADGTKIKKAVDKKTGKELWSVEIKGDKAVRSFVGARTQRVDANRVTITHQYYNNVTGQVEDGTSFLSMEPDRTVAVTKDSGKDLVEPLDLLDVQRYMQPKTDTKAAGKYYSDFPESVRNKWNGLDDTLAGDDVGWFASTPERFPEAMGADTIQNYNNLLNSGLITKEAATDSAFMDELLEVAIGQAYIKNLGGAENVAKAVKGGHVDIEVFYSEFAKDLPAFRKVHTAIGITPRTDAERFNELIKREKFNF